jgi:integrase
MPEDTTKKEADKELDIYKDQVRKGIYVPDKDVPLFSEVAKEWLDYKKPSLRETTWEVYEGHIRNHFGSLNRLQVNQITVATVEKFITARQVEGMNIGTHRKILVVLGQILKFAVRRHYHYYNPLRDAERPREQAQVNEDDLQRHDSMHILTPPQINAFLGQKKAPKYKMLFTLAIFTGARQGELLGLKWGDVDWNNRQIRIQRTFNKGRFFPPKTKASRRKIDLAPMVVAALRRWKLACPNNELDLVFPNEAGEPINHSNMVQRHFLPGLRAAGLPRIRFHDLRHTYASILIENDENIKYIQTQMGHSSPTVTLNVYAHLMKPTNQEAALRLENAIFGATGHKTVTRKKKGPRSLTVTP